MGEFKSATAASVAVEGGTGTWLYATQQVPVEALLALVEELQAA